YSSWVYSGIFNLAATAAHSGQMTPEDIAERLKMPLAVIRKVISFLLETGILVSRSGQYEPGAKQTWIGADSPLVDKHHQNWRLPAINQMPYADEKKNLFFTGPMSLSSADADRIRADLPNYISKINSWVGPSASQVVRCLNIDFFEY